MRACVHIQASGQSSQTLAWDLNMTHKCTINYTLSKTSLTLASDSPNHMVNSSGPYTTKCPLLQLLHIQAVAITFIEMKFD